ncbi:MAG: uracil-DNA glycosylase [Thermodesulfobacteriota bacterium]
MEIRERRGEIADLARQVVNLLNYFGQLGVAGLPRVKLSPEELKKLAGRPAESLDRIRQDLGECTRCSLCRGRRSIVFGEGPAEARLMFIGEGPGEEEDRQGRPFVGPAGQLLTDIIVKGMKRRREDCYIANVVKCRPPGNRDPEPDEARACLPFLWRQIQVVRPEVIVALGRVAAHYLLDTDSPLGRLRNRFHDLNGIAVMPTYHPSYLLRNPGRKKETWEDIKKVMVRLGDQ